MSITLHKGENCGFTENVIVSPPPKQTSKSRQTIFFENPPRISGRMAVVGEKEGKEIGRAHV